MDQSEGRPTSSEREGDHRRAAAATRSIPRAEGVSASGSYVTLGETETRSQYSATLSGPDAEDLYRWAPRLKERLGRVQELTNISTDLQIDAPRVNVDIRRDLCDVAERESREDREHVVRRLWEQASQYD